MELINVLDESGNLTVEILPKSELHGKGLWHRTVHLWVINSKAELLLQHRSSDKESHPNMWDISIAGHISAGENSKAAALREANEEVGLSIAENDLEYLFSVKNHSTEKNGTYINNEFQDVYLLSRDIDTTRLRLQETEVTEVQFVHYKNLEKVVAANPSDYVPHAKEYEQLFNELHTRYP